MCTEWGGIFEVFQLPLGFLNDFQTRLLSKSYFVGLAVLTYAVSSVQAVSGQDDSVTNPGNCFESGPLQSGLSQPGGLRPALLFRVPKGASGGGACVSACARSAPQRPPSGAPPSRSQPVGPAKSLARAGRGDSWLADGLLGAERTRANATSPSTVPPRAAIRPAAAHRGAYVGRGAGSRPGLTGAGMPLFFSLLLAFLLVALSALFLGR